MFLICHRTGSIADSGVGGHVFTEQFSNLWEFVVSQYTYIAYMSGLGENDELYHICIFLDIEREDST